MARLGGTILTTESAAEFSSAAKGETLEGEGSGLHLLLLACRRLAGAGRLGARGCCQFALCSALRWLHVTTQPSSRVAHVPLFAPPLGTHRADTIRTVESYADVVVLRHFQVAPWCPLLHLLHLPLPLLL